MKTIHQQIPWRYRFIAGLCFILQHFSVFETRLESLRKWNVIKILNYFKKNKSDIHLNVDTYKELSESDFISNYLNKGLPVIFSGGANDWPCTQKWSLDYLKATYPEDEFSLIDSAGLVEKDYDKSSGNNRPVLLDKIKAKDFVDSLKKGNPTYLRFCPIMETHPELCEDLDQTWLEKMRRCFLGISYQTFIGPAKRKTPLHSEVTAFFYIMADGEKKWTLFSTTAFAILNPDRSGRGYNYTKIDIDKPDLNEYPGFEYLQRYTCHLKKGDILFVPAWMWHQVENVTPSWGCSYRFTSLRGFLQFPAFVFIKLFLIKPSFLEILYYSYFRGDVATRDKNLLTPKIYLRK